MSSIEYANIPNSETPIPLKQCPSLQVEKVFFQSELYWVIKSPHDQEYHHLNEHEYAILERLDGKISYRELREQFNLRFSPFRINFKEITTLLTDFFKKSIVEPTSTGIAAGLYVHSREKRREKLKKKFKNILAIQWKGWDPQRFLDLTYPWVRHFFSRPAVIANLMLLAICLIWMGLHFSEFFSRLPTLWSFIDPENWISLGLAVALSKFLHELGHAYTHKRFGGECHEIGVMIFFFTPTLYCNTSDSWMLKDKWKRMWIGLGGVYVELFIFSVAASCWWFSPIGDFQNFCMNLMFVCSISAVVTNGNPLMRFDGYYVLADWLEIPNLAQKSNKEAKRLFLRYACGDLRKVDLWTSASNKRTYLAYSVAAFCFRLFLLATISVALISFSQNIGLAFFGVLLGIFSVGTVFYQPFHAVYKHLKEPGNWQQMKRKNLVVTSVAIAILLAVVFLVPFPHWIAAECVVRYGNESKIYIKESGTLADIFAAPGTRVAQGDVIARLHNNELAEQRLRTEAALREVRQRIESAQKMSFQSLANVADLSSLAKEKISLEIRIQQLQRQMDHLEIKADQAGIVVGSVQNSKKAETRDDVLNQQFGNALDVSNLNCSLEKGQLLCIIAPPDCGEVSLVVEQSQSGLIKLGQTTKIMLNSHTQRLHGKILSLAKKESHVDELPEQIAHDSTSAAVQHAKQLAAPEGKKNVSYKDGQTMSTTLVEARSSHSGEAPLVYGSTGKAYIHVGDRTLAEMLIAKLNEVLIMAW